MPGKQCIAINLKNLCLCFAKWASEGFSDAHRTGPLVQAAAGGDLWSCQFSVGVSLKAGKCCVLGLSSWASIPGVAHVAPQASCHALPLPALCVSVNGDTCKLLPYGADLILVVCVLVHSHSKAQIGNIKKQTGLFIKLPTLKCVECDSVCVADKILQIGRFILRFLWTYLKYPLPSLSVLMHMFPAVFYRGCFQLQQVKRARQHLLEGLCLKCLM